MKSDSLTLNLSPIEFILNLKINNKFDDIRTKRLLQRRNSKKLIRRMPFND